jgi:CubicO group peptidase (beta-lactamase class C family)
MTLQQTLDQYAQNRKGAFFYGESRKNKIFRQSGSASPTGESFSPDTVYSWGSVSKFLTGLVCTMMMERGYINASTTLFSIAPDIFYGNGTYFTDITVTNPTLFPQPGSYTSTTATFSWQTVTVGQLLQFGIGLPDDIFFLTSLAFSAFTNPTSVQTILQTNNVQGLGGLVQFYTCYKAMLDGTPLTPACKVYSASTTVGEALCPAIADLVALNRDGVLPALFSPGSYLSDALPYQTRRLNTMYDSSYFILGAILDRVLPAFGYTNYADFVQKNIFNPLQMTQSYILLQQNLPNNVSFAQDSWRRSPSLGLTAFPVVPTVIPTWLGYECDPGYRASAGPAGPGPLAWDSDFQEDGISRVITGIFYNKTAIPGCPPLGNAPLVSSISDMGRLLKFITKSLFPGKCPGRTPLGWKPESVGYFLSPKIQAINGGNPFAPYPLTVQNYNNLSFCMGFNRLNRDLANNVEYGFDENTLTFNGLTGSTFYVNLQTQTWFVYGVNESFLSSGNLPLPGIGSTPTSLAITSGFLVSLLQESLS